MTRQPAILMISATALLSGCATQIPADTLVLTVSSQPPGAYITEKSSKDSGMAPLTQSYSIGKATPDKDGCYKVSGFDARWGSGAAASSAPLLRLCRPGKKFSYVLKRKPSDPGLDKDLAFANTLRRQQQEDEAAVGNAVLEGIAAGIAATSSRPAGPQEIQLAPTRCVTKQVWGRIETECQ